MRPEALRRLLHAGSSSVLLLGVISWDLLPVVLVPLSIVAALLEILRLRTAVFRGFLSRFAPLFREAETTRPSGAFWLCVGYTVASWFPEPVPRAAILTAALADPTAAFVGSRWGRGARKSWVGTVSAAAVAGSVIAFLGWGADGVLAGAAVTALLERWPGPVDDNLLVPTGVAAVLWLALVS